MTSFYKYFHGNCSDELFSLVRRLHEFNRATRLASKLHPFTFQIDKYNHYVYFNIIYSSGTETNQMTWRESVVVARDRMMKRFLLICMYVSVCVCASVWVHYNVPLQMLGIKLIHKWTLCICLFRLSAS